MAAKSKEVEEATVRKERQGAWIEMLKQRKQMVASSQERDLSPFLSKHQLSDAYSDPHVTLAQVRTEAEAKLAQLGQVQETGNLETTVIESRYEQSKQVGGLS